MNGDRRERSWHRACTLLNQLTWWEITAAWTKIQVSDGHDKKNCQLTFLNPELSISCFYHVALAADLHTSDFNTIRSGALLKLRFCCPPHSFLWLPCLSKSLGLASATTYRQATLGWVHFEVVVCTGLGDLFSAERERRGLDLFDFEAATGAIQIEKNGGGNTNE